MARSDPYRPVLHGPTPAGEANDPLQTLEHQHDVALASVGELDDAARSIREKGFTAAAFDSIARAAGFLDGFFRKHDALEEEHFFPAIERVDPAQARAFREEHRAMRSLFANLTALVRDIEGGRIHGSSVGDLLRTSHQTVTLVRRHIIHENDVLYPLMRAQLSAAEIDHVRLAIPALGY